MSQVSGKNTSFEDRRGEFMAAARLEYLQDEKGIYGVSIPFLACNGVNILNYILRPDQLDRGLQDIANRSNPMDGAALQILPKGKFRSHYIEHRLIVALAEAIHIRGGFVAHLPSELSYLIGTLVTIRTFNRLA